MPLVALADQDVDRAGAAGALADPGAQGQRGLLQRQGHAGAVAAAGGEGFKRGGEGVGRGVDRLEAHRDPGLPADAGVDARRQRGGDRMRSEEHTSELQSLMRSSSAVIYFQNKHVRSQHHYYNTQRDTST